MPNKRKLIPKQIKSLIDLCRSGCRIEQVAAKYSVSESTVTRILRGARAAGAAIKIRKGRPSKVGLWRPHGKDPTFSIIEVPLRVVRDLCVRFHGYKSVGKVSVYSFAVMENGQPIAAFSWQPPPPGAAKAVCPEAPDGVLALSRMVAVPKNERRLRHISKPLRHQMRRLIDRTRWPVLITYSDEGQGHTGHVYKCSGWEKTQRARRVFYVDPEGRRASVATSDKRNDRQLRPGGETTLQRWEHWACARGKAAEWMTHHRWRKISLPGRTWRSGNAVFTWVRNATDQDSSPPNH